MALTMLELELLWRAFQGEYTRNHMQIYQHQEGSRQLLTLISSPVCGLIAEGIWVLGALFTAPLISLYSLAGAA